VQPCHVAFDAAKSSAMAMCTWSRRLWLRDDVGTLRGVVTGRLSEAGRRSPGAYPPTGPYAEGVSSATPVLGTVGAGPVSTRAKWVIGGFVGFYLVWAVWMLRSIGPD
jgi:hypothetical protein